MSLFEKKDKPLGCHVTETLHLLEFRDPAPLVEEKNRKTRMSIPGRSDRTFWAVRSGFELRDGCGLQRQSFYMDIVTLTVWVECFDCPCDYMARSANWPLPGILEAHCQCAHFSLSQARQFRDLQNNAVSSGSSIKQRGVDGLVSSFPEEAGQINIINLQWSISTVNHLVVRVCKSSRSRGFGSG